jgi:hypothetical protein
VRQTSAVAVALLPKLVLASLHVLTCSCHLKNTSQFETTLCSTFPKSPPKLQLQTRYGRCNVTAVGARISTACMLPACGARKSREQASEGSHGNFLPDTGTSWPACAYQGCLWKARSKPGREHSKPRYHTPHSSHYHDINHSLS